MFVLKFNSINVNEFKDKKIMIKWIRLLIFIIFTIVVQEYSHGMDELLEPFRQGKKAKNPLIFNAQEISPNFTSSKSEASPPSGYRQSSGKREPILGQKFVIYDEKTEIKMDNQGRSYSGISLEELGEITSEQHGEGAFRNDLIGVIYNLGVFSPEASREIIPDETDFCDAVSISDENINSSTATMAQIHKDNISPAANVENLLQVSSRDPDDRNETDHFQKKKDEYDQQRLERYIDLNQSEEGSNLSTFYQERIVNISDEQEDRWRAQSIEEGLLHWDLQQKTDITKDEIIDTLFQQTSPRETVSDSVVETNTSPHQISPKENCPQAIEKKEDRRRKVETPTTWPWITHGHLRMVFGEHPYQSICYGSGVLVSDFCVLTAGHNLFYKGITPKEVSFFVGMKDGIACSVGMKNGKKEVEFKAKRFVINPSFVELSIKSTEKERWASDIGLVHLEKNLGECIGTSSYGPKLDLCKGKSIRISGYPSYVCGSPAYKNSLYTMVGKINIVEKDYIHYDIFTSQGQSGSCVCENQGCICEHQNNCICDEKDKCVCLKECSCDHKRNPTDEDEVPFCFAIHTYGPNPAGNIGTLVTKEKYERIEKWIDYLEKGIQWWK